MQVRSVGDVFRVSIGDEHIWVAEEILANRYLRGVSRRCYMEANRYGAPLVQNWKYRTLVDIGANVGELSLWVLSRGGYVVAIEPDEIAFEALQRNLQGKDAVCVRAAAWNANGMAPFYQHEWANSTLVGDRPVSTQVQTVRVERLKEEMGVFDVALLKLDCVGAEPQALDGCEGFMECVERVGVDVAQGDTLMNCRRALLSYGFEVESGSKHVLWADRGQMPQLPPR